MTRFILSIVFCIGTGMAFAQGTPGHSDAAHAQAGTAAPVTNAQPKIVQAALVLPTNSPPMRGGTPTAAQDTGVSASPATPEEEHPTVLMLLAAFALMIGIALRRWSLDDQ